MPQNLIIYFSCGCYSGNDVNHIQNRICILLRRSGLKVRRSGYHQVMLFCDESCQKYLYFKVRVKIRVRNLRITYYWFVRNRWYNLFEYFKPELILSSLVDWGVTLESECLGLGTQNAYKALNKVWNDSDIINIWQVMLASCYCPFSSPRLIFCYWIESHVFILANELKSDFVLALNWICIIKLVFFILSARLLFVLDSWHLSALKISSHHTGSARRTPHDELFVTIVVNSFWEISEYILLKSIFKCKIFLFRTSLAFTVNDQQLCLFEERSKRYLSEPTAYFWNESKIKEISLQRVTK